MNIEPPHQQRGTFDSRYALKCQPWKKGGGFRLLDFITMYQKLWDGRPPAVPGPDEFAVVDTKRGEIGYFERNEKCDVQQITSMINGHFGETSTRIFDGVWIV